MAWSLFLRWSGIPNNLHDCVQNEGHEKTYQLMIANMAMSDLLYPIFLFPWFVAGMYMYVDSWPVSGRLGIKNLLDIFTWIRYHPCKISVYVFQELSPFMAQAYCAINPWLCLIFSVKYRQGLNKSHCRQGSPKSELEERWPKKFRKKLCYFRLLPNLVPAPVDFWPWHTELSKILNFMASRGEFLWAGFAKNESLYRRMSTKYKSSKLFWRILEDNKQNKREN